MNYNNSDIDWGKVNEVISLADRIFLTTHENPDGDGLGAECGLYYHLKEQNKDVRILNYSPLPSQYKFLDEDKMTKVSCILLHVNLPVRSNNTFYSHSGDPLEMCARVCQPRSTEFSLQYRHNRYMFSTSIIIYRF